MPNQQRHHDVRTAAHLTLVTVAVALSFARVFDAWRFLTDLAVIAVASHVVALFARRRGMPGYLATIVQILGVCLVIAWLRLRDTLWFGLPLGRTWNATTSQLSAAADLVGDIKPPISFDSGFGLAACLAIGAVALLSDAFAFRAAGRGEALVPSAIVFTVVTVVGEDRDRVALTVVWLFACFLALMALRPTESRRSTTAIGALFMASLIAILAGFVGPRLPDARGEALIGGGTDEGRVVEPLVDIRGRLGDRSDTVLFRVQADAASYWHLTSLSDFDGVTWGVPEVELESAGGELAESSSSESTARENSQIITIDNLRGNSAPVAYQPTQLLAASRSLFYALESGTLVVGEEGLKSGDSYQIVSDIIDPPTEILAMATTSFPPSAKYFELPTSTTIDRIGAIARDITSAASSSYGQALALQSYFRDNFTYSLDVPSITNENAFTDFLDRRSGYCEQFASTFAVMARSIGLPSRVAVGFTPGESDGLGRYTVRSQHAHAWPEVWFDGFGWLMFEPTPGRGEPGRTYTGVEPQQDDSTPASVSTTSATITTTLAPANSADVATSTSTVAPTNISRPEHSAGAMSRAVLVVIVMFIALCGWPLMVRGLVRRRLSRIGAHPLLIMWRRMIANDGTIGANVTSLTPGDIAERLTRFAAEPANLPGRLAEAVERLLFAELQPDEHELDALRTDLEEWIASRHPERDWRHEIWRRFSIRAARRLAGV